MQMSYKGFQISREWMGPYLLWTGINNDIYDGETGNGYFVENSLESLQDVIDESLE
jgi:hypothetical protein